MDTDTQADLELAQAFARAYREIDAEAMRGLLAPNARVRLLLPRGFFEHIGADALIAALREFAQKWTTSAVDTLEVELLAPNLMQTGRLVSLSQRFALRATGGDRTASMVIKHLLAITGGTIALVDELCTGVMPDAR